MKTVGRTKRHMEHGEREMDILNNTTYFTIAEVAALLRVSRETIKRRIRNGDIKALRISQRTIRIPIASVEALQQTTLRVGSDRADSDSALAVDTPPFQL